MSAASPITQEVAQKDLLQGEVAKIRGAHAGARQTYREREERRLEHPVAGPRSKRLVQTSAP